VNELDTSREGQPEPVDQRVRREHDWGSTLVELLISIVLIGMVVVSVLAAAFTSISASSTVFEAAQVETVLLNAGDRVARAPQLCDYEDYVDAAALAEGWPLSSTSVVVESLVANTGNPSDWTPQSCPDDVRPFDVQRLTITASTPSGEITRTLTVVKSNVE
jgi:type II secretory pathway pseudopilin PulG